MLSEVPLYSLSKVVCFSLSQAILIVCACVSGRFIEFPRNTTAGLNLGAVFVCRFRGTAATAIVNGIRVEDRADVELIPYDFEPIPEGTYDLAIRVNASEANNNSEIWCQGFNPNVNSSRALLTVQGEEVDLSLYICWYPPYFYYSSCVLCLILL